MGALPRFAGQRFATHLHVRSGFSYGQGVAYPEELVSAAAEYGLREPGPHRPGRPVRGT